MLFNSFDFLVFFPIVFIIYWFVLNKNLKYQNIFLLLSSYVFYAWWDWRFLLLIIFSSIIDYNAAIQISKTQNKNKKKHWLILSLVINLGLLAVLKYFNFFSESFSNLFSSIGWQVDTLTLNVILPVGISFYTFQTLSYTIDVYRKEIKPSKDIIAFFTFVTFFPQLVAGPIERAKNLLPQFYKKRKINYAFASDGMRQIAWGLFKKVVVADNAAIIVNEVFINYQDQSAINLLIGAIFFAFQIYGDFSGYSDIAIGTARLLGFDLKQNFAFPYFSRDIAEFWRRWHISLSTWFRDYVYIPLGGSKGSNLNKIKNTFIIFLVSGLWHGANWTFIFWGLLNALYFLPLLISNRNRSHINIVAENSIFPNIKDFIKILFTFFITVLAWVFFRAPSIEIAFEYIFKIFNKSLFQFPSVDIKPFLFITILIIFEWINRKKQHGFAIDNIKLLPIRWILYIFVFCLILLFHASSQPFIYFQF